MEKVAKEPSFPLTPSVRNFVMYVSIWACFFCLEHLIFKIHSRVYHFQHPCSLDFKIFYIYPLPQWMDTNLPTFPSLQEACFHFDAVIRIAALDFFVHKTFFISRTFFRMGSQNWNIWFKGYEYFWEYWYIFSVPFQMSCANLSSMENIWE